MGYMFTNRSVPPVPANTTNNYDLSYTVGANLTLTSATFTPASDITPNASDNRVLQLRATLGGGSAVVAEIVLDGSSQLVNGVYPQGSPLTLTIVNSSVPKDAQLFWKSTKNGTSMADPGGTIDAEKA